MIEFYRDIEKREEREPKPRSVTFDLWEKSESYDTQAILDSIEYLYSTKWIQFYAYCLHNNDFKENGEPAKNHYRVYLEFPQQRLIHVISDKLQDINHKIMYEVVGNREATLRYILHLESDSKHHYSLKELATSDIDYYLTQTTTSQEELEEEEIVQEIEDFIQDLPSLTPYHNIIMWCRSRGPTYTTLFRSKKYNYHFCKIYDTRQGG